MSWKKVNEVKKGSIIDVKGTEYLVEGTSVSDLQIVKVGGARISISLQTLIDNVHNDDWEGANQKVYVIREPQASYTAAPTDFVRSELEAKFAAKGPSLEDQLKAATGQQAPSTFMGQLHMHSGYDSGVRQPTTFAPPTRLTPTVPSLEDQLKSAKTESSISDLRSQLSGVAVQATAASQGVVRVERAVEKASNHLSNAVFEVHEKVYQKTEEVQNQVTELGWNIQETQDDLEDVQNRVESLEHQALEAKINQDLTTQKSAKAQGGNSMSIKKLLGNFTGLFGKVQGQFAYSPAGLAVRKNPNSPGSTWVVFDAVTRSLTDVQDMVLDFDIPAFQLPVTPDAVNEGDILVNNGKYQYVTEVYDDYVKTVSPADSSYSNVMPVKNLFLGKSFYTAVKTLDLAGKGGFDPMLLMAMGKGEGKQDLLPFLLMSGGLGGNGTGAAGGIDPMMLALIGDNTEDILPFILMQQGGVADKGINPLMLLMMTDKGGSSKDSLLPLLLMSGGLGGAGGAQAGGIQAMLPFLLMGDKGGDSSGLKDILMMQALGGGAGGFGNLFGGQAATPVTPATPAE